MMVLRALFADLRPWLAVCSRQIGNGSSKWARMMKGWMSGEVVSRSSKDHFYIIHMEFCILGENLEISFRVSF